MKRTKVLIGFVIQEYYGKPRSGEYWIIEGKPPHVTAIYQPTSKKNE